MGIDFFCVFGASHVHDSTEIEIAAAREAQTERPLNKHDQLAAAEFIKNGLKPKELMAILEPVSNKNRNYNPRTHQQTPRATQDSLMKALDQLEQGIPLEPIMGPSSKELPSLLVILDTLTSRLSQLFETALKRVAEEAKVKEPISLGSISPTDLRIRPINNVLTRISIPVCQC